MNKDGGVDNEKRRIPLSKGKYAIVDSDDFEIINSFKWHFSGGYACRSYTDEEGKRRTMRMHQLILNCFEKGEIDHINRNGLDNRKSNLRRNNAWKNAFNRKRKKKNSTGYRGVWKVDGKYIARIQFRYKPYYLGAFKTKLEAAKAYNKAVDRLLEGYGIKNEV